MIDIEKANARTVERMMEARPVLVGVGKALDVIPGMRRNLLLHAGPPVTWERMAGPMKGAVYGALIFEGKAKDAAEAEALVKSGKVEFEPCHHHGAVGPMAGVISPSMLVYVVENKTHGQQGFLRAERRPRESAAHGRVQPGCDRQAPLDERRPGPAAERRPRSDAAGSTSARCWPKRCTWATTATTAWMRPRCSIRPPWRPRSPR